MSEPRPGPAASVVMLLIRGYQKFISPLRGPTCRFYPSCSAYAMTSVSRFGFCRGTWLAIQRILRCHPWNPGGIDKVPENLVELKNHRYQLCSKESF